MRAIVVEEVGGPEVLRYKTDWPEPALSPGTLKVRNEYAGVNFIDVYFRMGLYPSTLPSVQGTEGAGTVVEVAPDVTSVSVGDKVAYIGRATSYAEVSVVPASKGLTALALVKEAAQVKAGDTVLVHAAAGGTGQQIARVAAHLGARVIGTTSTPAKAEVARQAGCSEVIIYTEQDVAEEIKRLTGGKGVHAVFDGVGKATFDASLRCLGHLGFLISFGNASGKPEPVDIMRLAEHNIRLMRPTLFGFIATPEDMQALTRELFDLVDKGVLAVNIHKVYPLADAAQAQIDLASRATTGKLLLQT